MKKFQSLCYPFCGLVFILALVYSCVDGLSDSSGGSGGKGGSMARFAITGNYLYTVDYQTLKTIYRFVLPDPLTLKKNCPSLGNGCN